jgi:RecJ-like exonuclease
MLNACGRMDLPGLAVQVCLGDRGPVLDEIQDVITRYRRALSEYMDWLAATPSAVMELNAVCVVRGEEKIPENMTGALSSILSSAGHLRPNKATIVAAKSRDGGIKVSARAPDVLLKKGVDLGVALQKAAGALGGFGGGHNVAAGAHIGSSNGEEFYRMIDQLVSEQMNRA